MKVYKLSPSARSTFNSTNLDSAQSFTINEEMSETLLGSDGLPYQTYSGIDGLSATVSVVSKDTSIVITPGTSGTLTLEAAQHADGGSGASTALVFTFTKAVYLNSSRSVPHAGESEQTFNFRCISADGSNSYVAVS